MTINDTLFIIPARGGSKGVLKKNIRSLNGKPLLYYSIDAARGVTTDENICVSSDDEETIKIAEDYGLKVPFKRPAHLATDSSGTYEVLLHAVNHYAELLNKEFSKICLLQPTSPLRTADHILEAFQQWDDALDMVVSVNKSKQNPYYNLFEESAEGFLRKSKEGNFTRRQDVPNVWAYNGAIYLINVASLKKMPLSEMKNIRKYVMPDLASFDIDDMLDFKICELLMKESLSKQ